MPVGQDVWVGSGGADEGGVVSLHQKGRSGPQTHLRGEVDAEVDGAKGGAGGMEGTSHTK